MNTAISIDHICEEEREMATLRSGVLIKYMEETAACLNQSE